MSNVYESRPSAEKAITVYREAIMEPAPIQVFKQVARRMDMIDDDDHRDQTVALSHFCVVFAEPKRSRAVRH